MTGVPSEATRASSSGQPENDPGDDESSDDDKKSVKLQGSSMLVMSLVIDTPNACSWYTPRRKFLIPTTTPEGGKDSTKTDHSIDDLHLRFPERSTVFKEMSEQQKTIRIVGAGFINFTSAEKILCNIGLVFERNLSIMPL